MKVFISHSSTDSGLARKLAIDLKAVNLAVWLDQWELEVGEEIAQTIENGVGASDFVLVLLSQYSVASRWVTHEWRLKVLEEAETQKIAIIPVRCEQCEIPDFLAQRSFTDISGGNYPLGFNHLLDILSFYAKTEIRPPTAMIFDEKRLSQLRSPVLMTIELVLGSSLKSFLTGKTPFFKEFIPQLEKEFEQAYGFAMPNILIISGDADLRPNEVQLLIEKVTEAWFEIAPEEKIVHCSGIDLLSTGVYIRELELKKIGATFTCFSRYDCAIIEKLGVESWDVAQFIAVVIKLAVRKHAPLFMDMDNAHQLVETVRQKNRALVEKTIPNIVSWIELTDVLRRLVEEEVPVTNMPKILEVLSQQKAGIQDTLHLTELVRQGLCKQLTKSILKEDHELFAIQLDQQLEAYIVGTVQNTSVGPFINLDRDVTHSLLTAIRKEVRSVSHRNLIIIVRRAILRKFLRKLVELEFPWLRVFSIKELQPEAEVELLAEIRLPPEVLKTYPIQESKK